MPVKFRNIALVFRLLLLIYAMQAIMPATAQLKEEDFILYSRKNGLTNNNVTGLVQDDAGYIWISTAKGLNRYDGSSFFPVYLQQFKCFDEYGGIIRMKYFGNNEIGIATNNGGYAFNTLTLKSKAFLAPPLFSNSTTFNKCRDISKNKTDHYFISTGTGFYIFNKEGKLVVRKDAVTQKEAGDRWFQFGRNMHALSNGSVLQENQKNYYLYHNESKKITTLMNPTAGGVYKKILTPASASMTEHLFHINKYNTLFVVNAEKNKLEIFDNFYKPRLAESIELPFDAKREVRWQNNFYFLNDSTFAITLFSKGFYLFHYNPATFKVTVDPVRLFGKHFCTALLLDKNNKLWIGTDKGLLQQQSPASQFKTYNLQDLVSPALSPYIKDILVDSNGIFVGGRQIGSLLILDASTKSIVHRVDLSSIDSLCNNIVSIYPISKDTLWLGTDYGLLWLNKNNYHFGRLTAYDYPQELNDYTNKLSFIDSRKNLWFIINEYNTVFYYSTAERKFHLVNPISAGKKFKIAVCSGIGEDANGNIWFAGDGICRWNPATGLCDSLLEQIPNITTKHAGTHIFYTDEEKNIWFSVLAGIYRWDPVKNKGKLYNVADGLPDNIMFPHVSPINKKKLFLHTNYGLAILDLRNNQHIIFTEKDGIPDVTLASHMAYNVNASANEYLFGYANYLLSLSINYEKRSPPPLSLNISSLNVLQDTIFYHPRDEIELKYNQNDLSVSFNAVNFIDPDNQVFAYRLLKTKEHDWTTTNRQNIIYLNDLSPGTYQLQVKVMAANKRWADQFKELMIIINPPFWETWWFITMLLLVLVLTAYLLIKTRVKNINQKANLDKLLAQTKMKALHAQMNPHFIFNCLNSINEMILLNENTQASKYLSKFAHLIRITLEHSTQAWTSLRQTIDYLKRYLEMENIRIDDVSYSIHTDDELDIDEIFLPPMLIQPLIENAIWHGKKQGEALTIDIRFEKSNGHLLCIVSDNGLGIEHSIAEKKLSESYQSIAINNIKQRIQLLNEKYNLTSELTLQDKKESLQHGTIATLKLPLKIDEE